MDYICDVSNLINDAKSVHVQNIYTHINLKQTPWFTDLHTSTLPSRESAPDFG